jgi:N-acetylmuramoyl-L-alanine amidase
MDITNCEAAAPTVVCFSAHRFSSPLKRPFLLRVLLCVFSVSGLGNNASPARKQEARLEFEKAEQMREALDGRPEAERTHREYQKVADAYRKVYYLSPASSKADASVVAVAELLAATGRQFQPGEKDLQAAIGQYEFVRREYPGSKYRVEALFTIGQIYKEDLGDTENARAAFEEFLKRYPHDARAAKAREALAELNKPKGKKLAVDARSGAPKPAAQTPQPSQPAPQPGASPQEVAPVAAVKKSGLQLVTGIRHWSSPTSTRIAIDVDGPVEYQAGRVPNPDRIFFDLPRTRLVSTLVGKSFDVQDGFLKKIRVAQYQADSTRIVLDVQDVAEYSAFLLPNPYRLIIDVHGRQADASSQLAEARQPSSSSSPADNAPGPEGRASRSILSGNLGSANSNDIAAADDDEESVAQSNLPQKKKTAQAGGPAPSNSGVNAATRTAAPVAKPSTQTQANEPPKMVAKNSPPNSGAEPTRKVVDNDSLMSGSPESHGAIPATSQPTSEPTAVAVAPRNKQAKKKPGKTETAQAPTIHEAVPTSGGDRSLIRALGLKIGRIVIDAGHGGHDTGTIGPNGVMEKEVVLDVALRLGRLLETRLGADVIYTRDDDTFIPLETRTAIANEKQADLFVSIHANSSPDATARGVETYYLNFTSSPDALEVAARENAVSEKSIHELQDLVKKITLKEKIEESRELASDVQQSLYTGLSARNSSLKNRGVKKAPFVVLIGANMPSILAEISFVSNPTDEAKLDTPEYRQKIAESLYKGVAKYAGGLSGVKVASKIDKSSGE